MSIRKINLELQIASETSYENFISHRINASNDIIAFYSKNNNVSSIALQNEEYYLSMLFNETKLFSLTFQNIDDFKKSKLNIGNTEITSYIYLTPDNILDHLISWSNNKNPSNEGTAFAFQAKYLKQINDFFKTKFIPKEEIINSVKENGIISEAQFIKHSSTLTPEQCYLVSGFVGSILNFNLTQKDFDENTELLSEPLYDFRFTYINPANINVTNHNTHDKLTYTDNCLELYKHNAQGYFNYLINNKVPKSHLLLDNSIPLPEMINQSLNYNLEYHSLLKNILQEYPKISETFFSSIPFRDEILYQKYFQSLSKDKDLFLLFYNKQMNKPVIKDTLFTAHQFFLKNFLSANDMDKYPDIFSKYKLLDTAIDYDKELIFKEIFSYELNMDFDKIFKNIFPTIHPNQQVLFASKIISFMKEYFLLDNKNIEIIIKNDKFPLTKASLLFTSENSENIDKSYLRNVFLSFLNFPQIENFISNNSLHKELTRNVYLKNCLYNIDKNSENTIKSKSKSKI